MSCSEARSHANRANAQKSTGPTTEEGKARSRSNALKHGLTGELIAVPGEDAAEIDRRIEAITADLNPRGELAVLLTRRVAGLTVRLERSMRQESAVLAAKARHAGTAFDDMRVDEADHLIAWIASEPATFRRKLERTPEGCDRLISALRGLRVDLLQGGAIGDGEPSLSRWSAFHGQKFDEYLGRRFTDYPASRCYALTQAMQGDAALLFAGEAVGLEFRDLKAWARDRLAELIDDQVARLVDHRAGLDHEAITLNRAEAGTRALFDASPTATLARKYEAATERQLFRTLRELREVQQGPTPAPATPTAPLPPAAQPVAPDQLAIVASQTGASPLGSFWHHRDQPDFSPSDPTAGRPHPLSVPDSRDDRDNSPPVAVVDRGSLAARV